jgi:hypothetical protein
MQLPDTAQPSHEAHTRAIRELSLGLWLWGCRSALNTLLGPAVNPIAWPGVHVVLNVVAAVIVVGLGVAVRRHSLTALLLSAGVIGLSVAYHGLGGAVRYGLGWLSFAFMAFSICLIIITLRSGVRSLRALQPSDDSGKS